MLRGAMRAEGRTGGTQTTCSNHRWYEAQFWSRTVVGQYRNVHISISPLHL
ncbi:hypothetical protein BDV10DRAFT_158110, partial [Aspergillus recurvatus]